MCRKRFNRNRVASSENYEQSKKIHRQVLEENHRKYGEYLKNLVIDVIIDIKVIRTPHVLVFGEFMPITREEASKLQNINIHWL